MVCTIFVHVVKTKALIRCVVTTQLICAFVFSYAKRRFSHDVAYSGPGLSLKYETDFKI